MHFNFWVRHFRSTKEKKSNLDGTLYLHYNVIEILETWKRGYSCLDLQKVSDRRHLFPLPVVLEIYSFKIYKKGVFLEKIAFNIRNLWKCTNCLRLILPTYLPIFIEISWVLPVLWSIEHVYGSFNVKMKSRMSRFCQNFQLIFLGNSDIASIYHCPDRIFFRLKLQGVRDV